MSHLCFGFQCYERQRLFLLFYFFFAFFLVCGFLCFHSTWKPRSFPHLFSAGPDCQLPSPAGNWMCNRAASPPAILFLSVDFAQVLWTLSYIGVLYNSVQLLLWLSLIELEKDAQIELESREMSENFPRGFGIFGVTGHGISPKAVGLSATWGKDVESWCPDRGGWFPNE